jgi:hypothetical protein
MYGRRWADSVDADTAVVEGGIISILFVGWGLVARLAMSGAYCLY